jgi:hypothetical protein
MISQKKLEANRRNAAKSTGPTSDEGKTIASRNSLKHGLYSSNPLLHDEKPAEYQAFRAGLLHALKPADALQHVLADRVIVHAWKLRRTGDIEDAVIRSFHGDWNSDQKTQSGVERIADFFARTGDALQLDHVSRYEQRMQRSMQAALRQLMQVQKQARENQQEPDAADDAQKIRNEPTVSSNRINSGHLASDSAGSGVHSTADSVSCPAFHSANETKEYESSA